MKRLAISIIVTLVLMGCASLRAQHGTKAAFEAEVLYISPKVILPHEIKRAAGPFLLVIKNYTSLKGLVVSIQPRAGGPKALQTNLDDVNGSADTLLNLQPGVYDLSEANHPGLKCTITITQ